MGGCRAEDPEVTVEATPAATPTTPRPTLRLPHARSAPLPRLTVLRSPASPDPRPNSPRTTVAGRHHVLKASTTPSRRPSVRHHTQLTQRRACRVQRSPDGQNGHHFAGSRSSHSSFATPPDDVLVGPDPRERWTPPPEPGALNWVRTKGARPGWLSLCDGAVVLAKAASKAYRHHLPETRPLFAASPTRLASKSLRGCRKV